MDSDLFRGNTPLLVDITEAARLLGVSTKTVWSAAKTGHLPSVRFGRRRLFSRASLEKWIEAQQATT